MDCWLLLIAKIQKMNVTSADDVCTFHFYTKSAQNRKSSPLEDISVRTL